jgi:dTDP-D-glucose 4,6-dehydratase
MLTLDKCNELHAAGWVCDGETVRTTLGWQPAVRFSEGVKVTADWYRKEGWL